MKKPRKYTQADLDNASIKGMATADTQWRNEIEKYMPSLEYMSFCGPKSTIRWLFNRVIINDPEISVASRRKKVIPRHGHR